jgi:hypothetical protein
MDMAAIFEFDTLSHAHTPALDQIHDAVIRPLLNHDLTALKVALPRDTRCLQAMITQKLTNVWHVILAAWFYVSPAL